MHQHGHVSVFLASVALVVPNTSVHNISVSWTLINGPVVCDCGVCVPPVCATTVQAAHAAQHLTPGRARHV